MWRPDLEEQKGHGGERSRGRGRHKREERFERCRENRKNDRHIDKSNGFS